jgi:hypothetical protein
LAEQWTKAQDVLSGGQAAPGPELVASVIADAIETDRRQLRWPVGADAEMVAAARQGVPYDEFESTMRTFLGIDW